MLNFNEVNKHIAKICSECDYQNTERCDKKKCNIGFTEEIIKIAEQNDIMQIENGNKLVPSTDMKYYREELIADSIAEVCKLCNECRENHTEHCVISICRHSFENTVLKENLVYPGSVLMYIMGVARQNPEFAEMIRKAYKK
jgi:hypothetical protein